MNYDRVILELLDRVAKLEDEVSRFKQDKPSEIELQSGENENKSHIWIIRHQAKKIRPDMCSKVKFAGKIVLCLR